LAPGVPRVYLIDEKMERETGWNALLDRAAGLGAGIGPVGYLGYPGNIGKAHRRGMCVHIYTINVKWQMRLFAFFGADGFFSDRCDLVMDFYGRKPKAGIAELLDKYARPAR
jgi:glycerophosphoryl diester phosphodiesterase